MHLKGMSMVHIVAYRGYVGNQKGSPRVNWIIGRLNAKKSST